MTKETKEELPTTNIGKLPKEKTKEHQGIFDTTELEKKLQQEINYFMEIKHTEISSWAKKIIEERLLKIKKEIQKLK